MKTLFAIAGGGTRGGGNLGAMGGTEGDQERGDGAGEYLGKNCARVNTYQSDWKMQSWGWKVQTGKAALYFLHQLLLLLF